MDSGAEHVAGFSEGMVGRWMRKLKGKVVSMRIICMQEEKTGRAVGGGKCRVLGDVEQRSALTCKS